ncbi:MAG TPA: hypothetical protein VFV82_06555 [Candidatus Binatia bacterium]|nr:hypothetical protein [Candidatus Binatia bacterium]
MSRRFVQTGDEGVVTPLSGTRGEEGGAAQAARGEPADDFHWLATGQLGRDLDAEPVRYTARPSVATKLDPYKGIIARRQRPQFRLTAQRLFEEIQARVPGCLRTRRRSGKSHSWSSP